MSRLDSTGKDVLQSKQFGLSDEHFEMLVFCILLFFNSYFCAVIEIASAFFGVFYCYFFQLYSFR